MSSTLSITPKHDQTHLFEANRPPSIRILTSPTHRQLHIHVRPQIRIRRTKSCMRSLIVSRSNAAHVRHLNRPRRFRKRKEKTRTRPIPIIQHPFCTTRHRQSFDVTLHRRPSNETLTELDDRNRPRSIGVCVLEPAPQPSALLVRATVHGDQPVLDQRPTQKATEKKGRTGGPHLGVDRAPGLATAFGALRKWGSPCLRRLRGWGSPLERAGGTRMALGDRTGVTYSRGKID